MHQTHNGAFTEEEKSKDNNFNSLNSALQALISKDLEKASEASTKEDVGVFKILSGNQCLQEASRRAVPIELYKHLWYQGELVILYADTGLGKSIFAVQMGNEIAKERITLYIDLELSDKQFEARYSENFQNHFKFENKFFRAEINADEIDYSSAGFKNIEDYIFDSIEKAIVKLGVEALIIDNITYLRTETEKAKDALPLMKRLKAIKNKYGTSLLVLAHTPKRDLSKPLTRNDLQGSKMLINFCDGAFAIGESTKDPSIRYIKQIKSRNGEAVYTSENVAVYEIIKPTNFLHFDFQSTGSEQDHLKIIADNERIEIIKKVQELSSQGKSQRAIADELGIALGTVNKYNHKKI